MSDGNRITTSGVRPTSTIGAAPAVGLWFAAWLVGGIAIAPVLIALAGGEVGDDLTVPQLAAAAVGMWAVFLAALYLASRQFGTGSPVADLAISFRPIDLVGVPIGVVTQFALVPALYWPLRELWPDTFAESRIEERAQELADQAGGTNTVLLVLVVVVGAPIVEELVYRGLLQRSVSTATGAAAGLLVTAALFSLIHLSPVEYPGLFLAGLVFGGCVAATGRLGMAVVTHAAFNAAGLIVVLNG